MTHPDPAANPHPNVAKIELGHVVDAAVTVLVAAGQTALADDLAAKALGLDLAWRQDTRHRQAQLEVALGYDEPKPFPEIIDEAGNDHKVAILARQLYEELERQHGA